MRKTMLLNPIVRYLGAILLVVGLSTGGFAGEKKVIPYEASYMGIALLDMTLTWEDMDSTVQITYDNQVKPFIGRFHHIHNIYQVHFEKQSYKPISWSKKISEGSMDFFLEGNRPVDGTRVMYSNGATASIPGDAFTVFSATHFLASRAHDAEYFPVDIKVFIDGEIWKATATRYTATQPPPDINLASSQVLIQTDLQYVSGKRVMEENDILMDVIATEGTRFILWVEEDGSYSKAQFGKFPKAVVMERLKK